GSPYGSMSMTLNESSGNAPIICAALRRSVPTWRGFTSDRTHCATVTCSRIVSQIVPAPAHASATWTVVNRISPNSQRRNAIFCRSDRLSTFGFGGFMTQERLTPSLVCSADGDAGEVGILLQLLDGRLMLRPLRQRDRHQHPHHFRRPPDLERFAR